MRNDFAPALPHPPGRRPIIGDVLGVDRRRPLQSTIRRGRDLGPIFEVQVFGQKLVFVAGAETAAELCDESRFRKGRSSIQDALRDVVGDGLFTAHHDEPAWRLAHDLLVPAFSKASMRTYHPVMLGTIGELFAYWDAQSGPVDVARDMTKLTLETIGRAAFSQDLGSFTDTRPHPFAGAMVTQLEAGRRKGALSAFPGGALLRRRIDRSAEGSRRVMTDLVDGMIARRREDGAERDDLLGIMVGAEHPRTGERLSDANIRHQILTFLVAGHETTSGALSFALHHLARNPEVRARVTAEVDAVLGPDPTPSFEDVARLRTVRHVVDETLRLHPTVPAFPRSPRADTTLGTGHRMRTDNWALVLTAMTHRDRGVWGDDADEFDPDRFTPQRSRGRMPHAYKPFGTGERSCIGRQFALHEAVLALALLLHRYDIAPEEGYELQVDERLTLMPTGLRLHLTARRHAVTSR